MGGRSDERTFVGKWGTFVDLGVEWELAGSLSSSLLDQRREDMMSHRSDNQSIMLFFPPIFKQMYQLC